MTEAAKSRTARIEKLAVEAEMIGLMTVAGSKVLIWAEDNGSELAKYLRDLKTRIEAEDGDGL